MQTNRVIVFAEIEMKSSLHLGSGEGSSPFTDQPIFRSVSGDVVLPGSSLAGAFAENLSDKARKEWMGIAAEGKYSRSSSLIMNDALLLREQRQALNWPVEIRSRVSLEKNTLSALPRHLFNMETVPPGAVFCFSCRCDLHDNDVSDFLGKMKSFLSAGGELGGARNSGLGEWKCNKWAHRCLTMTDPGDLAEWLIGWHGYDWQGDWKSLDSKVQLGEFGQTPEDGWKLRLKVEIKDGLHLSAGTSGLPVKGAPDLVQATRLRLKRNGNFSEEEEYADYGTSVKGRIRAAMELLLRTYLDRAGLKRDRIFRLVPANPTESSESIMLDRFFGSKKNKGYWKVNEDSWHDAEMAEPQDHIKLCEFTQRVIDGAKFNFGPLSSGEMMITLTLDDKRDGAAPWQKALLYGAARLLATDIIPFGGHASRGYLGARISLVESESDELGVDYKKTIDSLCEKLLKELTTAGANSGKEVQNG
jgi:CRISPR/Cas system CSM-associated protein Csm3 (group 7 of RAMP superfamily)